MPGLWPPPVTRTLAASILPRVLGRAVRHEPLGALKRKDAVFCSKAWAQRRRRRRARVEAMIASWDGPSQPVCAYCGEDPRRVVNDSMDRKRSDVRYCSAACRQRAYRKRARL
jgi:hypothetical protein